MSENKKINGKIDLGTIGMGIPIIYTEVVAKIISYHLAVESTLLKYIKINSLNPVGGKRAMFRVRLETVNVALGKNRPDWSITASRLLNDVRSCCAHIDDEEYQSVDLRIHPALVRFVNFVEKHNTHLDFFKERMCNFEWACTMTYQRLHGILGLKYDSLGLDLIYDSSNIEKKDSLPETLKKYFEVAKEK